jgi:heme/copper-type cytochrome/quinol oxidase subunit 1
MWGFPGPFYVIEGAHAVAETAMVPALLSLWKAQRTRLHRPGNFGFVLTVAATALLAAITYITVILPLGGIIGESLVGTVLFLLSILGTVVGFIVCGIATILARVWPSATGPLLIAHPLLLLAVLAFYELWESYATFIAVGLLWFAIAWILATRKASDQTGQPA